MIGFTDFVNKIKQQETVTNLGFINTDFEYGVARLFGALLP